MDTCVKIRPATVGTLLPELLTAIAEPTGPHFIESRHMIGRISETATPLVGGKCDEFMVEMDERCRM